LDSPHAVLDPAAPYPRNVAMLGYGAKNKFSEILLDMQKLSNSLDLVAGKGFVNMANSNFGYGNRLRGMTASR
jgi:hypothetical protein